MQDDLVRTFGWTISVDFLLGLSLAEWLQIASVFVGLVAVALNLWALSLRYDRAARRSSGRDQLAAKPGEAITDR